MGGVTDKVWECFGALTVPRIVIDVRIDKYILIGHSQRVRVFAALKGSSTGIEAVGFKFIGPCVTEIKAHNIAHAGIEHVIELDADTVRYDAADAVWGRGASVLHRDKLPCGDAVGKFALSGAEGLSVVAVGDVDHAAA